MVVLDLGIPWIGVLHYGVSCGDDPRAAFPRPCPRGLLEPIGVVGDAVGRSTSRQRDEESKDAARHQRIQRGNAPVLNPDI
jgi:hypothetical protein